MYFKVWQIIFKILNCQRILEDHLLNFEVCIAPAGDLAPSYDIYRHIFINKYEDWYICGNWTWKFKKISWIWHKLMQSS